VKEEVAHPTMTGGRGRWKEKKEERSGARKKKAARTSNTMCTDKICDVLGARKEEGGVAAQDPRVSKEGKVTMEASRSYDARERRCQLEWNPNWMPLIAGARLCAPPSPLSQAS
jgi:hypothetical protein